MASEDVIEVESSDDDAEPAPKKMKPVPNAMVHIPRKIHGVTVKPSKCKSPQKFKSSVKNPTTITKLPFISNPCAMIKHANGSVVQNTVAKLNLKPQSTVTARSKVAPNPFSMKLSNPELMIKKVPINFLKNPIKVNSPRTINNLASGSLSNLPPGITVTKTTGKQKRKQVAGVSNVIKKQRKVMPKSVVGEVLTVELDDDDAPCTVSPQWYIRPEEQEEMKNVEQLNNEEPEPSNLIEITIEDSPVKPTKTKRTCEVGDEIAITIEDSPVKKVSVTKKTNSASGSDDESNDTLKDPLSKKKLEYPKKAEEHLSGHVVEIEIEGTEIVHINGDKANESVDTNVVDDDKEIQVLSEKKEQSIHTESSNKDNLEISQPEEVSAGQDDNLEFHPVYQSFIALCFKLENSEDMQKIVEKKIKAYYKQVSKTYTESEEFIDMVSSKILAMKAGPEKMYLYIKDIVDELNLQRKLGKSQVLRDDVKSIEPKESSHIEETECDRKRQRQIRKLEKTIKKLHRAIQKLEEQEVDFDDEEDSVYLLTERYKERMIRVHAKFCQLTNTKLPSEPRLQIDPRPGHPLGPAKKLEKLINKKVPIGTPLPFPDFHDVVGCVKEANEEDKLGWNDVDIMEEARDLFIRCGKKLQRRRQENEWRSAASRLTSDVDFAEESDSLNKKLEDNRQLALKKETELFDKYADKQKQLRLEAEEIGDKEAEESPVESEDDEQYDERTSLETESKRKERLKRLLQEKLKKNANKKESQVAFKNNENIDFEIKTQESNDQEMIEKEDANKNKEINDETKLKEDNNSLLADAKMTDELKDPKAIEESSKNIESVQSLSDDDDDDVKEELDLDELHLLQKLHSENERNSSTSDSSGSESPIAILDSLDESDETTTQQTGVISIENSSYSESEDNNFNDVLKNCNTGSNLNKIIEDVDENTEIECTGTELPNKTNDDECSELIENVLLASSDEENAINNDRRPETSAKDISNTCSNLNDNSIYIGETVIEGMDIDKSGKKSNVTEVIPDRKNANEPTDENSVESVVFIAKESSECVQINADGNEQLIYTESNITKAPDTISIESKDTMQSEGLSEDPEDVIENSMSDVMAASDIPADKAQENDNEDIEHMLSVIVGDTSASNDIAASSASKT